MAYRRKTRARSTSRYSRKPARSTSARRKTGASRGRAQTLRIEVVQAAPQSIDRQVPDRLLQMRSTRSRF